MVTADCPSVHSGWRWVGLLVSSVLLVEGIVEMMDLKSHVYSQWIRDIRAWLETQPGATEFDGSPLDGILRVMRHKDELRAAAEAERDVERRDRTAAEFEMLADRELLRELYEHEINEYGRWTAGMCQRVCVAAKGGRDE